PAAQKERGARTSRIRSKIHDEIVRFDNALIPGGDHVRDVDVVDRSKRIEDIVSSLIDGRKRELFLRHLKQPKIHWPRWNEALVHENIDRIRMIDSDELHLIGVCSLPELFGELKEIFAVARLHDVAIDTQVFL